MKVENLNKKVSFKIFSEKIKTCILSDFKNPKDILPVITKLIDPLIDFKKNNSSTELRAEEKLLEVKKEMQQQQIKLYIGR